MTDSALAQFRNRQAIPLASVPRVDAEALAGILEASRRAMAGAC